MATALITGATSGLGRQFARLYARDGYDLVIVARNLARLDQVKNELEQRYHHRVLVIAQDLSEPEAAAAIARQVREHGLNIDALVNNAGFGDFGNFWQGNPAKQSALMQVNMVALVQLTRLFMPAMVRRHHGSILNVASVASVSAGPHMALYYASKAFVRSFSEAIADEARGTGVHVTALLPGPVSTGFEKASDMEKKSTMFTRLRPATAAEVARAGYDAARRGRVLRSYGVVTKAMILGERLVPRAVSRRFARWING
jgi:short-subunit dehydrogenase